MGTEEFRKKDEVTYYFNKEEYNNRRGPHLEVPLKSRPFKENKTLWIILLDLGVIFLFIVVLLPLLRKPYSVKNFEGYSLSLRSFISNEKVYAVLDAASTGKEKHPADSRLVTVEFYTEGEKNRWSSTDFLPDKGKKTSYTHLFDASAAKKMFARVHIGTDSVLLRVKVTE